MRFCSTLLLLLALMLGAAQRSTPIAQSIDPSTGLFPAAELLRIVQDTIANVTSLVNTVVSSNTKTTEAFIDLVRDLTSANMTCTPNSHQLQQVCMQNISYPLVSLGTPKLQSMPRS